VYAVGVFGHGGRGNHRRADVGKKQFQVIGPSGIGIGGGPVVVLEVDDQIREQVGHGHRKTVQGHQPLRDFALQLALENFGLAIVLRFGGLVFLNPVNRGGDPPVWGILPSVRLRHCLYAFLFRCLHLVTLNTNTLRTVGFLPQFFRQVTNFYGHLDIVA
jgi:hypothetical protein